MSSMVKRAVVFLMALGLSGYQEQEPPTFRTTTRLVEIPLVAVDRNGAPVTDLKRTELTLSEGGARRDVAFLQYEGGPPAKPAPLPKGMFSNRLEFAAGPARNVTALLVDTLNTPFTDQVRVRAQVVKYLRELRADTRIAVYHLGKALSIVHDFSQDPESLRGSLAKISGDHGERAETDAAEMAKEFDSLLDSRMVDSSKLETLRRFLDAEAALNARVKQARVQATLAALGGLGRHLSEMPGRKNLVWVTGGLPLVLAAPGARGEELTSLQGVLRETAQRLAQAGVALYIVDARGIQAVVPAPGAGRVSATQSYLAVNEDVRLSSAMMASITGGRFIGNSNEASDGLRDALRDLAGAYTIGFYTDAEGDGRWRDVSVQTSRPGVKLQAKSGYLVEKPTPAPELTDADWRKLIASREPDRGVLIKAFAERDAKTGSLMMQASFDVGGIVFTARDGAMEAEVESCLAEINEQGRVRFQSDPAKLRLSPQEWKLVQTAGVPWARAWKPREDTVRVKLLVRDRATGAHGALEIPLDKISP